MRGQKPLTSWDNNRPMIREVKGSIFTPTPPQTSRSLSALHYIKLIGHNNLINGFRPAATHPSRRVSVLQQPIKTMARESQNCCKEARNSANEIKPPYKTSGLYGIKLKQSEYLCPVTYLELPALYQPWLVYRHCNFQRYYIIAEPI